MASCSGTALGVTADVGVIDPNVYRASFEQHTMSHVANHCSEPAGHLTGGWIELDGGLHRSAF